MTNFLSVIEARSLGTADIDRMAAAIDKQTASLDKLAAGATKVSEHPGFDNFAQKIKAGIQDPLGAAGDMVEGFLQKLGPMGTVAAGAVTVLGALGAAGMAAAKSLGNYAHEIEDTAIKTGLAKNEVTGFAFAAEGD